MSAEPIKITPDFVWPTPDDNGNRVLANGAVIGQGARWIACVGFADGYYKDLCAVGDVAYIGAGCRWFTLGEALRHWGNHEEDRRATMALMEGAKALATLNNLKWE